MPTEDEFDEYGVLLVLRDVIAYVNVGRATVRRIGLDDIPPDAECSVVRDPLSHADSVMFTWKRRKSRKGKV